MPELMFSTSRCLTFFNTGAGERASESAAGQAIQAKPHHSCLTECAGRWKKANLGLVLGAVRKQRLTAVYLGLLVLFTLHSEELTGKHAVLSTEAESCSLLLLSVRTQSLCMPSTGTQARRRRPHPSSLPTSMR